MQITVLGEATAAFAPERATVALTLGFEGHDKETVHRDATELANRFAAHVERLKDATPSPTTWSALLPPTMRQWRPYAHDGSVQPLMYAAASTAKLKFRDFRALAEFVDQWAGQTGVQVDAVEWSLTEERRAAEADAVLARAVESARARAELMATAAGYATVRFAELADPGLLRGGAEQPMMLAERAMMRGEASDAAVNLAPEDIELAATVHARFVAE